MPQDWYGVLDAVVEGRLDPMPSIGRTWPRRGARRYRADPKSQGPPRVVRASEWRRLRTDRDEIIELTVRYATAIDSHQYRSLTKVFADDAIIDYGEVGQWTSGAEVAAVHEAIHVYPHHTMHRMTNQAVDIDGDTAKVRTYVDALILFEGGGANPIGYYDDEGCALAAVGASRAARSPRFASPRCRSA